MIPIDYIYWFSFDHWTFEQAAYLFSNINPNDEAHISLLHNSKYKKLHANHYGSIDTFNKNLQLIKGTNFSMDEGSNVPAGSASVKSHPKLTHYLH